MDYIFHIFTLICVYATLSQALNLVAGHAGMVSLAHAGFYGLGAYASALSAVHWKTGFCTGLVLGMFAAILFAYVISAASRRLHDDSFVMTTFAFQVVISSLFLNWTEVTRGPLGIPAIPPPFFFGWSLRANWQIFLLAVAIASLAHIAVRQIAASPLGRILHAVREDEVLARSLGKNPDSVRRTALATSAAISASAGSVYAHYLSYIGPSTFTISQSILIVSMVIIGGPGSVWGPLIGAVILVSLPEALRFVGFSGSVVGNLQQIIYGCLLILVALFRPMGFAGGRGLIRVRSE